MGNAFKRVVTLGLVAAAISLAGIAFNTASVKAETQSDAVASKTTPEVDKTELQKALGTAGEKEESDYTAASWKVMDSALDHAKIVYVSRDTTQIAVDSATQELNDGIFWLVPVNKSGTSDKVNLSAALQKAKGLTENDYTTDSWNTMQGAYNDALNVLHNTAADQGAVNTALTNLNQKISALVKKDTSGAVNKADLQKAVESAKALKEADYSKDSWKTMAGVLDKADKVMKDGAATQETVNATLQDLNKAVLGLVSSSIDIDKTALSKELKSAEALNEKDYTQESWKAMHAEYLHAVIVFQNRNASQQEVNTAAAALQKAVADLIKNPQPQPGKDTVTVISDNKNGVEVNGQFDKGTTINVQPVDLKALGNRITDKSFLAKATLEKAFDINLMKDNMKVEPSGEVEVSIHIDSSMSKKKLAVIYIDQNGNIQIMPSSVQGDKITFKTTHFSTYAIVSYKDTSATVTPVAKTTAAPAAKATIQTGDETNSIVYILLTLVAGAGAAVCIYRRVKLR